jgi:probable HAF family extracellular repeat protein
MKILLGIAISLTYAATVFAQPAPVFTITDLGTLGGSGSYAYAINNRGHVVGASHTATGKLQPFLWTPEKGMVAINTLLLAASAIAINDNDQVVGLGDGGCPANDICPLGFVWTPDGGAIIFETVPNVIPYRITPTGLNNSGVVSGYYDILPPPRPLPSTVVSRPFVWTAENGIVDLGVFPGSNGEALAINNRGAIAGIGPSATGTNPNSLFFWTPDQGAVTIPDNVPNSPPSRFLNNRDEITGTNSGGAFLWSPKTGVTTLGASCTPTALNDRSEVVGNCFPTGGIPGFFYWSRQLGMIGIGSLGQTTNAPGPVDINDRGEVVGTSSTVSGNNHAFYWSLNSGMIDLGTLGSDVTSSAVAINKRGQIVGTSSNGNTFHAVLWTPLPCRGEAARRRGQGGCHPPLRPGAG